MADARMADARMMEVPGTFNGCKLMGIDMVILLSGTRSSAGSVPFSLFAI